MMTDLELMAVGRANDGLCRPVAGLAEDDVGVSVCALDPGLELYGQFDDAMEK